MVCDALKSKSGLSRLHIIEATAPAVTAIVQKYYATLRGSSPAADVEVPAGVLPIGVARTVLQAHMRTLLTEGGTYGDHEFAVVLDDDKRLPHGSFLSEAYLFSLDQSVIYLGRDCKTAPNTLASAIRAV